MGRRVFFTVFLGFLFLQYISNNSPELLQFVWKAKIDVQEIATVRVTGEPTSGPISVPTSASTSGPTSVPTSAPTSGPTLVPTSASTDPTGKATFFNNTSGTTSVPTSASTNQTGKATIFYNLFLKKESDMPRVTNIIKEQFNQLKSQFHGDVFVTSIGLPIPNLQSYTNASKVTVLNYTKNGDEVITLQNLHAYCSRNTGEKVVYLHSKGSFHPKPVNDQLRQVLTFSALSNECATVSECDVCSIRMSPLPHAHTSGNMWLAQCSYISKLLDPITFLQQMSGRDSAMRGTPIDTATVEVTDEPAFAPRAGPTSVPTFAAINQTGNATIFYSTSGTTSVPTSASTNQTGNATII